MSRCLCPALLCLLLPACTKAPPPGVQGTPDAVSARENTAPDVVDAPLEPVRVPRGEPESGEVVTTDPLTGRLVIGSRRVVVGAPLTVRFQRMGRNGCYRQTEATHEVGDGTIRHAYDTRYEGEVCTMALVPGGFVTTVVLPAVGTWQGEVVVDGVVVATYGVEVEAP